MNTNTGAASSRLCAGPAYFPLRRSGNLSPRIRAMEAAPPVGKAGSRRVLSSLETGRLWRVLGPAALLEA